MKNKIKGKINMLQQTVTESIAKRSFKFSLKSGLLMGVIGIFSVLGLVLSSRSVSAACTAPSTNYGSANQTVNVTNTGVYHIWSRIMVPSSSASYLLEVDGGTCYTISGGSTITPNTWTWVDFQNGTSTSKADVNFTATGNHTLKLIGNSDGMKVDRVLLLTDNSCGGANGPTGTGDNCLVVTPPPTPPTVSMSASPTTVTQGQTVTLSANATDNANSTISSVAFFDGTTQIGSSDFTSPYSVNWSTSASTLTGPHTITAKATDALGLSTTSSPVTVTVNAPADTTAPTVSLTSPTNSTTVKGTVAIAATATDNTGGSGVKNVVFKLDNTTTLATDTTSPYTASWDSTTVADGTTHTITAIATDVAGNSSSTSVTVTVDNSVPVNDIIPPVVNLTSPLSGASVSGNQVNLSATATDNVKVASVTFSIDGVNVGAADTTLPYSVTWDSTKVSNGPHTLAAYALDTSGNPAISQYLINVENGDITAPSAPTNLTASPVAFNQVNLAWTASTDNAGGSGIGGYYIVRDGVTINTLTGTATTYSDTSVTASSTYQYAVIAFDVAKNPSASSNTVTVTTPSQPDNQVPTWPSAGPGLTATAVSTSQINLAWNTANDNMAVKAYQIYRNNGTTPVATVNAPTTSWGDIGLTASTTYSYTVRAVDAAGNLSVASNTASATTQTPVTIQTGNLAGSVTLTNSTNPYSCPSHPTLSKVSSPPSDPTVLVCSKRIQWFLNSQNSAGLTVDGWIGSNTDRAIRNYQTRFGLTVDGIVGPQTWGALESHGSTSTAFGSGTQVSYTAAGALHYVIADNEGYYIITNIPAATYSFTYSLPNFASQTKSIAITGGQTATYNVTLQHL